MNIEQDELKYPDAPPNPDTHKPKRKDVRTCNKRGHIIEEVSYYDSSGIGWCSRCGLMWEDYELRELRSKGLIKEQPRREE